MEYEGILVSDLPKFYAVLEDYAQDLEQQYKAELIKDGRYASHKLHDSVKVEIGKISPVVIAVVLNAENYYKYVDKGRNFGKMPPVANIRQWIDDKGILPREAKMSKESMAWAIAKKIGRDGYEGSDTLIHVVGRINEKYLTRLKEALQEDFDTYCSVKVLDDVYKSLKKVF